MIAAVQIGFDKLEALITNNIDFLSAQPEFDAINRLNGMQIGNVSIYSKPHFTGKT